MHTVKKYCIAVGMCTLTLILVNAHLWAESPQQEHHHTLEINNLSSVNFHLTITYHMPNQKTHSMTNLIERSKNNTEFPRAYIYIPQGGCIDALHIQCDRTDVACKKYEIPFDILSDPCDNNQLEIRASSIRKPGSTNEFVNAIRITNPLTKQSRDIIMPELPDYYKKAGALYYK